jgi:hypothetical protein
VKRRILLTAMFALGCSGSETPPRTEPKPPDVDVAPVTSAPAPQPSFEPVAPKPTSAASFDYRENGDHLSFTKPNQVSLRRATHGPPPCVTELATGPAGGNMYTADDVIAAFEHPDVQKALRAKTEYADQPPGTVTTPDGGVITWKASCPTCFQASQAVAHFRDVLEVLMRNRRLVCK